MVISCSIWSIWSLTGAFESSPGTTMDAGSAAGVHRGGLDGMGVVMDHNKADQMVGRVYIGQ